MLSVSHAATGAFIAAKLQNPLVYIPVVLLSHYIEDWIIHWDVGTGLSNGTRKRSTAFYLELVDIALAGVIVLLMYPANPFTAVTQMFSGDAVAFAPFFGAFLGLLPDFLEAPRNFFNWNPWFLKPLNRFHHSVHRSTPNMIAGLLPQIAVLAAVWILR